MEISLDPSKKEIMKKLSSLSQKYGSENGEIINGMKSFEFFISITNLQLFLNMMKNVISLKFRARRTKLLRVFNKYLIKWSLI
jgi:hypothetical protein